MRFNLLPSPTSPNLTLVLSLSIVVALSPLKNCYAFGVDELESYYQMSVAIPESNLPKSTNKVRIPYSYKLINHATKLPAAGTEMRITFNVLNANCYAFRLFKAKYNQDIKGSVYTNKCKFDQAGDYVAIATICSKKALGLNELCRTTMGNIKVKARND